MKKIFSTNLFLCILHFRQTLKTASHTIGNNFYNNSEVISLNPERLSVSIELENKSILDTSGLSWRSFQWNFHAQERLTIYIYI